MAEAPDVQVGDTASWKYGGNHPEGNVEKVEPNDITITTHRGNEVTRHGTEDNPAVELSQGNKPVVKKASELEVVKEGPNHASGSADAEPAEAAGAADGKKATSPATEKKTRGRPKKSETPAPASKEKKTAAPKAAAAKKTQAAAPKETAETSSLLAELEGTKAAPAEETKAADPPKTTAANGETEKKKPGRKGKQLTGAAATAKKEKDEKPKKRAATETGEPRRSKRNKA